MKKKPRVLIADDDLQVLETTAEAVEELGAEVVRAASGVELIQRLTAGGLFDLIVTDISMPWISGLQVIHTARAAGLRTPVIVMTALKDAQIAKQVDQLASGAVLLRKPFDLSNLQSAMRDALSQSGAVPSALVGQ